MLNWRNIGKMTHADEVNYRRHKHHHTSQSKAVVPAINLGQKAAGDRAERRTNIDTG